MSINPDIIKRQIENLRISYPELVEDAEGWLLSLESETDLDTALTSIVRQISDTKALEDGTKVRLEELRARADRFGRREDILRGLAFKLLEVAGVKKRELPEATLSIRNGQAKLIGEADPETVPDEFCKVTRSIDRTKVKDAIKSGRDVPGFTLSNGEQSLAIRIK